VKGVVPMTDKYMEISIPRLGWSMEEGVFSEWLKAPGEFVRAGEMVFVLEGEKAAEEIESFDSGYLWSQRIHRAPAPRSMLDT